MVVLLGLFANARKSQTLAHLKVSARGAQLYDGVYSCSIECQKSVKVRACITFTAPGAKCPKQIDPASPNFLSGFT